MTQQKQDPVQAAAWVYYEELHRGLCEGNLEELFDASCTEISLQRLEETLRCMDGRTPRGMHLAGSGILLGYRLGKQKAIKVIRQMRVTGVYSHKECGAAQLVARLEGLNASEGERLAQEWARYVSSELRIPYLGHLPVRHSFHPEMVIYVDGTGRWDNSLVPMAAPGFNVNAKHPGIEYAMEEVKIALDIAFGSHGMGEFFTTVEAGRPLVIVVIGDPRNPEVRSAEKILGFVREVVEQHLQKSRILVRAFTPHPQCFLPSAS